MFLSQNKTHRFTLFRKTIQRNIIYAYKAFTLIFFFERSKGIVINDFLIREALAKKLNRKENKKTHGYKLRDKVAVKSCAVSDAVTPCSSSCICGTTNETPAVLEIR